MQYKKDYLRSRGYEEGDFIMCEIPGCYRPAVDIHHVLSSMRGRRVHKKDGSDLIALCRKCHDETHSKNNTEKREYLLGLVNEILKQKS